MRTCSATRPPRFSLKLTNDCTSPCIKESKSLIARGNDSTAGFGVVPGLGVFVEMGAVANPAMGSVPFVDADGFMGIAKSSKREVAASSLWNTSHQYSNGHDIVGTKGTNLLIKVVRFPCHIINKLY